MKTNKEHILVLNCQYDLVLFTFVVVTKRITFNEDIYYNYMKCFRERQLSNDYKSCLQTANLFHGQQLQRQQVVTISLVRWQVQLSQAGGQVEF